MEGPLAAAPQPWNRRTEQGRGDLQAPEECGKQVMGKMDGSGFLAIRGRPAEALIDEAFKPPISPAVPPTVAGGPAGRHRRA